MLHARGVAPTQRRAHQPAAAAGEGGAGGSGKLWLPPKADKERQDREPKPSRADFERPMPEPSTSSAAEAAAGEDGDTGSLAQTAAALQEFCQVTWIACWAARCCVWCLPTPCGGLGPCAPSTPSSVQPSTGSIVMAPGAASRSSGLDHHAAPPLNCTTRHSATCQPVSCQPWWAACRAWSCCRQQRRARGCKPWQTQPSWSWQQRPGWWPR